MAIYDNLNGLRLKNLSLSGNLSTGSQPVYSNSLTVSGAKKITASGNFTSIPAGANEHMYLVVDGGIVATIHSGRSGGNTITYNIDSNKHTVYVQFNKTSQTSGSSYTNFKLVIE